MSLPLVNPYLDGLISSNLVSFSHACNYVMIWLPACFQRLISHFTRRIIGNPNSAYFPKTLSLLPRCLRVVEAVRQQVFSGSEAWVRNAPASSVTALAGSRNVSRLWDWRSTRQCRLIERRKLAYYAAVVAHSFASHVLQWCSIKPDLIHKTHGLLL